MRKTSNEHYRRMLEQKAEEVRAGLSATRAEVVRRQDEPQDIGDWLQKSHDEWLFLNQNRIESELLREVEAALHRLAEGDYGICQGCGAPILEERLEAVPWASHCVRCQEAQPDRDLVE
ncbi:MAG: TraR/DksA family transcriptional regulator [Bryobacteraceae bacterium]